MKQGNISYPGGRGRTISNDRPSKFSPPPAGKASAPSPQKDNPGGVARTVAPLFRKAGITTPPSWSRE